VQIRSSDRLVCEVEQLGDRNLVLVDLGRLFKLAGTSFEICIRLLVENEILVDSGRTVSDVEVLFKTIARQFCRLSSRAR